MNCIVIAVPSSMSELEREVLKDFEILLVRDSLIELTLKTCEELKRDLELWKNNEIKRVTVGLGK